MSGNEFKRIEHFLRPLTQGFAGAHELKDDVSCLPSLPSSCVTTDTLVEGVHFFGDEDPEDIAHKLFSVNLSDIISKGCRPSFYWLNMSLPASYNDAWWARFCKKLGVLQQEYSCVLAGGDSVTVRGDAVLSLTMMGTSCYKEKIITRLGAFPGDVIAVTGWIGDSVIGLDCAKAVFDQGAILDDAPLLDSRKRENLGYSLFQERIKESKNIIGKNIQERVSFFVPEEDFLYFLSCYRRPSPCIGVAPLIAEYAHASMDISDGLVSDLRKMCNASGVAADVSMKDIPFSVQAQNMLSSHIYCCEDLITGGDDYQVLFTCSPSSFDLIKKEASCPIHAIGFIQEGEGVTVRGDDGVLSFEREGYVHGSD